VPRAGGQPFHLFPTPFLEKRIPFFPPATLDPRPSDVTFPIFVLFDTFFHFFFPIPPLKIAPPRRHVLLFDSEALFATLVGRFPPSPMVFSKLPFSLWSMSEQDPPDLPPPPSPKFSPNQFFSPFYLCGREPLLLFFPFPFNVLPLPPSPGVETWSSSFFFFSSSDVLKVRHTVFFLGVLGEWKASSPLPFSRVVHF